MVGLAVEQGRLRADLFFRLGAIEVGIPALRNRLDDLEELLLYFLGKHAEALNRKLRRPSLELLGLLRQYSWPGNIRELEHIVMGAIAKATSRRQTLGVDLLPEYFNKLVFSHNSLNTEPGGRAGDQASPSRPAADRVSKLSADRPASPQPLLAQAHDFERRIIIEHLTLSFGNVALAARLMELTPQTLHYKIRKQGLDPKRYRLGKGSVIPGLKKN
ncbi:hypothetical protein FACS189460_4640 [Deltaproteobacteria bacterium]|nr:hypothetical protein FACS189460_4640 [Deltaproteobacteria bacterium]